MAKIDEVFNEKYPQLAKQLEELGITDTDKLVERFQSNGKYLNEVLEYDLKDNEKIRSIAESFNKHKGATVIKTEETVASKDWVIAMIIFFSVLAFIYLITVFNPF